jgi:glycosyltransferase involved in cell wall biosynthesis
VQAVEVATSSELYAWEPSGALAGAEKITLFPNERYEQIGSWRRFRAMLGTLRKSDVVLIGIAYADIPIIALSWLLPLFGVRVIMLNQSKHDDLPRSISFEWLKACTLWPYRAAIVGGLRQMAYRNFLSLRRIPVLPGYASVSARRVLAQAGGVQAPDGLPHGQRHFLCVSRFVPKKNMAELLDGYARYVEQAGATPRRLVLAGSGPLEAMLHARAEELGIAQLVDFTGWRSAAEVARMLGEALALVLVSRVEQWGLVVNEALAVGLPVIASTSVGACDALVRNLVNGYLVEPGSVEGISNAMAALANDEAHWRAMAEASRGLAWLGDAERFADAVECLTFAPAPDAEARIAAFKAAMGWDAEQNAPDAARRYV